MKVSGGWYKVKPHGVFTPWKPVENCDPAGKMKPRLEAGLGAPTCPWQRRETGDTRRAILGEHSV
jgi:hypothetical protein